MANSSTVNNKDNNNISNSNSTTSITTPSSSLISNNNNINLKKRKRNINNNNNNIHKRQRTDLFDKNFDSIYLHTKPQSTIWAPTFGNSDLEKQWNERTKKALLTFQCSSNKNNNNDANSPSDPIMKLLLKTATLQVNNDNKINKLRDIMLYLIYSSDKQQNLLYRPRNRRDRNNRNNNNNGGIDPSWYDKLPGPQPHSITRQNLNRLQSYYYWVTEKSDGIRFMLLLTDHPFETYLIGRKFDFYLINHPFYNLYLNDSSGMSLLDGELIINNNKLWYLAFDCISHSGKSLSNNITQFRVESAIAFVAKYNKGLTLYKEKEMKSNPDQFKLPTIHLAAKTHYKSQDINTLLRKISYDAIKKEYFFTDGERKTKNDGLIFTPQENNFLMSYDPSALIKWKFLEKNTIDLKVKTPYIFRNKLNLYAGGNKLSNVLFAQIDMTNTPNYEKFMELWGEMKLLSNMRNGFVKEFIIECAWNLNDNQWELIQNRPDKHIPNYITVCTDTLRVMMDNVTRTELVTACKGYQQSNMNSNNNQYQSHAPNMQYSHPKSSSAFD